MLVLSLFSVIWLRGARRQARFFLLLILIVAQYGWLVSDGAEQLAVLQEPYRNVNNTREAQALLKLEAYLRSHACSVSLFGHMASRGETASAVLFVAYSYCGAVWLACFGRGGATGRVARAISQCEQHPRGAGAIKTGGLLAQPCLFCLSFRSYGFEGRDGKRGSFCCLFLLWRSMAGLFRTGRSNWPCCKSHIAM